MQFVMHEVLNVTADLKQIPAHADMDACLLYTSDAADERSSVDLGGRRIIKKKKLVSHIDRHTPTK